MTILRKKLNTILLFFTVFLLGFYIYQTISISSGMVGLVSLKKEFLERKNNLNSLEPSFVKEDLKMAEIEKFDYIIIGPSEFALIEGNESASQ